jgi:hypothetical protein
MRGHQGWRARTRFMATGLFAMDELDFRAIAACGVAVEVETSLVYPTVLMPIRGVRVGAQLPLPSQLPA